ncbi:YybS family protein [Oceanobacillus sp. CAU 1775]
MNQSKRLTEGAIFSAIFIALMLASFIPILSLFTMILLPLPFVLYAARHGLKPGLLVLTVTSLLTIIFFTILSLPYTLLVGAGGLLIGHGIYKKRSAYETWAYGTLGFIGGILFALAIMQVMMNINFMAELENMAMQQMSSYVSIIESVGLSEGNPDVDLEEIFTEQINYMINLVPAFLALMAVGSAFLVQWMGYKIINRIEKKKLHFPPFRNLRLPISILWLYLIVVITSFFDISSSGIFAIGIQNALMILEMLLVIQGFSFIFYFSHYKKWSRTIPVVSIVLTIVFPIFLLYFIRILGIIDIGLNMRDRLEKKDK